MVSKEFKQAFDKLAKANSFEKAFGGWFKEGDECIIVLDLQKSNFGDYFELNIKIFIQGIFGNKYIKSKDLVKKDMGDVFIRQPNEYKKALDFDHSVNEERRKQKLEDLFREFISPFTDKALTKLGIRELAKQGQIFLLPAVKQELGI